jgi:hypothetical protein
MTFDLMIKDSLIYSNKYFNFLEAIHNPSEYIKLDDNILNIIENFDNEDPDLVKASSLVKRIKYRDLYKFIGEILIDFEMKIDIAYNDFLCLDNSNNYIKKEDIEIKIFSIDYGFGSKNPFEHTYFYKPEDPYKYSTIPCSKISLMVPNNFKEYYIRVYCKQKEKNDRVKEIFEKYTKYIKKNYVHTPKKNESEKIFLSVKREREHNLNKIN